MSLLSRLFRKAQPIPSPPEEPRQKAETVAPEPRVSERALLAAKEEDALKAATDGGDTQTIARLVIEGASTKVRQLAAQAVENPAQLQQLLKAVRGGNDKNVYKILARKRDAQLAEERRLEQLQAEVHSVAGAIERHSHRHYDSQFMPSLEQLEHRWKSVATNATPEVAQNVRHAIDRSREVIANHLREIAAQASRELAAANAAAEAQRLRDEEAKAAAVVAAERARVLEAERKARAEKQETEGQALRQIGGLVRKAVDALNEGSTGRAAGLRRAIEEKLATSPPLPAYLSNRLQQLDAKLNELKDWKSFSVTPKRAELIEEMESLVGSTLDPAVLADRIRNLQEDWRTLSKGAGENVEADWQRFQKAAQEAYQPCREHFEAQSRLRQENLERRDALLVRLAAFEAEQNWEQPDWRTVIGVLRESKQEWRRCSPVDRSAGKAQQGRFDALTASLQSRLDEEYARNIKEKKSLIESARRLLAAEDTRKAMDDVKTLQQTWKSVGLVPRDQDQSLWEEFRQHCDGVFQKQQQAFTEYTAGLETNQSNAASLCEQLEQIAALSGAELLESAKQLPEIRAGFEAVGELPRKTARALRDKFERALERCDRRVAREQARGVEHGWTALLDMANAVRAYRLAIARNTDPAECESLKQAVEGQITHAARLPKRGLEALKNAFAKAGDADCAANEMALRKLCIRAEILTDTPSPPDDQGLRREYQVQRLIENMGRGVSTDEGQLDSLAIEWMGIGPVEEFTYLPLLERFKRCREKLVDRV